MLAALRERLRLAVENHCSGDAVVGQCSCDAIMADVDAVLAERTVEMKRLRAAFDQLLISEVHRFGGIPHLRPEEIYFRDVLAGFLLEQVET